MQTNNGKRTLFASVLLSAPGPIVVGLGLLVGQSSTQLADFIRRSTELIVLILSWWIYRTTQSIQSIDQNRKTRLEQSFNYSVGMAMMLSGVIMIILSFSSSSRETGNVIPGLVIAILGVITNTWFWFRYHKLNLQTPNAILAVQTRLYQAKSYVDFCVTISLTSLVILPQSTISFISISLVL